MALCLPKNYHSVTFLDQRSKTYRKSSACHPAFPELLTKCVRENLYNFGDILFRKTNENLFLCDFFDKNLTCSEFSFEAVSYL